MSKEGEAYEKKGHVSLRTSGSKKQEFELINPVVQWNASKRKINS